MNRNLKLAAALILPILCLIGLTIYKTAKIAAGKEIVIPITGYDPRDLLSGHYLTFRLDLNNEAICGGGYHSPAYACLRQLENNELDVNLANDASAEPGCDAKLEGKCEYGIFSAGIERFYIPEEYAAELDNIIRNGKGEILVSIDRNGKATIKDLLINDRPWREYIE